MKPISVVLLLFFCACNSATQKPEAAAVEKQLAQLQWANATWGSADSSSASTEMWHKKTDSTFTGHSFVIAGTDTVFEEFISLEERNGKVNYIVSVKNQNGEAPVSFTLTKADKNTFVFENPEHDFPQRISYTLVNPDSLYAEISGTEKGKTKTIPFPMKRVK